MIFGAGIYSYMIGNLSYILNKKLTFAKVLDDKISCLDNLTKTLKIPKNL